jgi:hypothetical protein
MAAVVAQRAAPTRAGIYIPRLLRASSRHYPLFLHAPLVVLVAASWWLWDDPVLTLQIGGALVLLVFPVLAWFEFRRAPVGLSPLSFYFIWYTVSLGASALFEAGQIERRRALPFSITYVLRDDLAVGYIIFLAGGLVLHAAMQFGRPMPGDREPPDISRTPFGRITQGPVFLLLLWSFGVLVRVHGEAAAALGTIAAMLERGSLAVLCVYALSGDRRRRPFLYWTALAVGTAVEFAINIRTGSKAMLMYSFLPLIWLFAADLNLRRWMLPFGVAMTMFYLGVLSPVVSASRIGMREGESKGDRIVQTFVAGRFEAGSWSDSMEAFLERQFDPTPIAFIVREVDRRGTLDGETLDYLAYGFIPRIVWPDKPAVTRGRWFNKYMLGSDRDSSTNVGQTAIGELYWNFGMPGVVGGMFVIGVLIAWLWRIVGSRPHRDPIAMTCYLVLTLNMNNLTEAGTVIIGMTFNFLFFLPLFWFTRIFGAPARMRELAQPSAHLQH